MKRMKEASMGRLPRWSLVLLVACGGGDPNTSTQGGEPSAGGEQGATESTSEASTAGARSTSGEEPGGEAQAALPPLGPDASEAAHEAEYARGELHRLEVQLTAHLDREDIPCSEASTVAEEICLIQERICGMDQADVDVAARCGVATNECGEAGAALRQHCPETGDQP